MNVNSRSLFILELLDLSPKTYCARGELWCLCLALGGVRLPALRVCLLFVSVLGTPVTSLLLTHGPISLRATFPALLSQITSPVLMLLWFWAGCGGNLQPLCSWRRQTWDKTGFEIKFVFPGNFFGLTRNGSSIWQGGGSGLWEDRGRLAVPWLLLSGAYVGSFVPCLGSRK